MLFYVHRFCTLKLCQESKLPEESRVEEFIMMFKMLSDFTSKGSRRNNGRSQERKETETNVRYLIS